MTLNRSREMSETGLSWLGAVPSNWRRVPFWTLFRRVKRTGFEQEQLLSVYRDFGVIPKSSRDDNFNNASEDLGLYQLVEPGDLAINKMKAWQGAVAISEHRGIVSPAYFVFTARHGEIPRFLHYLFRSLQFTAFYLSISKGIRPNQWDLEPQEHSRMVVPLPPLSEQTAIASFLDHETGKIDALAEEQRQLIELLKEKRQAVISHAVTKGLDPDAKMKPSGVEWLGDVPEHWEVKRLGQIAARLQTGPFGSQLHAEDYIDGGTPVINPSNLRSGEIIPEWSNTVDDTLADALAHHRLGVGDVVFGRRGEMGRCALVTEEAVGWLCGTGCLRVTLADIGLAEFASTYLQTRAVASYLELVSVGSTMDNLNTAILARIPIPCPPVEEGRQVIAALHQSVAQIDALINEAECGVKLLDERRAALISAAVTGKFEVGRTSLVKTGDQSRLRLIVGAEIVERLAHKKTFGRVKLQKLLYLAEADAGISELNGEYLREAAGPLDRDLIADVEARLHGHVEVEQQGGPGTSVSYRVLGAKGTYRPELAALLGGRKETLDRLIELLGDMDTLHVEAAATLYAVWNDALLDGRQPTDKEIVSGVLEDWHPEKARKFRAADLDVWLGWMKRNQLVPRGSGPRTITGRLFA